MPSTRIGCLIGRGGAIITEMRNMTKANIRILPKDDLPKVAADDEELVQVISAFYSCYDLSNFWVVFSIIILFISDLR